MSRADNRESRSLTRVRLRHRGQELLLTEGVYLMGRDASCHILLDDAKVSRRHARLNVHGEQVSIDDLGSMNGLYVNGVRLTGSQPLFDGDWLTAGAEELEVLIGDPNRRRQAASTQDEFTPVPSSSEAETTRRISEPPNDPETTQKSRALEILASIADRALEMGRLDDAEDLLKTTLLDMAQESSLGHALEQDSLEFAVGYALRLAEASGTSRWFDFTVDLLKSQRAPCTQLMASRLRSAMKKLTTVDVDRLVAYAKALRASGNSPAEKSAELVDELTQDAVRKRAD
ncbi:MAG: FHA domain-containing protein [Myxococcales bacterium]|nr:FHA domain-containing protein [Myxococcales bacterium]